MYNMKLPLNHFRVDLSSACIFLLKKIIYEDDATQYSCLNTVDVEKRKDDINN